MTVVNSKQHVTINYASGKDSLTINRETLLSKRDIETDTVYLVISLYQLVILPVTSEQIGSAKLSQGISFHLPLSGMLNIVQDSRPL